MLATHSIARHLFVAISDTAQSHMYSKKVVSDHNQCSLLNEQSWITFPEFIENKTSSQAQQELGKSFNFSSFLLHKMSKFMFLIKRAFSSTVLD